MVSPPTVMKPNMTRRRVLGVAADSTTETGDPFLPVVFALETWARTLSELVSSTARNWRARLAIVLIGD
jgi:hypothetical protein